MRLLEIGLFGVLAIAGMSTLVVLIYGVWGLLALTHLIMSTP